MVVSLASNHSLDGRELGVLHNLETFKKLGISVFGTGENLAEARKPAIVEKNGIKVAFLGYCSIMRPNDPATSKKPGQVPIRVRTWYEPIDYQAATPPRVMSLAYEEDVEAMVDDIRKVRSQADVVIVSIHWGIHFIPKMIAQYQPPVGHAAIDAGADLILGCHSHNPKAIEVYKGKDRVSIPRPLALAYLPLGRDCRPRSR